MPELLKKIKFDKPDTQISRINFDLDAILLILGVFGAWFQKKISASFVVKCQTK
jgi:hypothetical protein